MARTSRHALRTVLLALTAAAAAGIAQGSVTFEAILDELQMVPPSGSPATGTAVLVLNDAQTEVAYTITYSGLEGVETDAHFHNAGPGQNGSVVHFLPAGNPKAGIWNITVHDVAELFAGRIYVNIHTTLYPGGEIRGDIMESVAAAPDDRLSWSRIKALYQ